MPGLLASVVITARSRSKRRPAAGSERSACNSFSATRLPVACCSASQTTLLAPRPMGPTSV